MKYSLANYMLSIEPNDSNLSSLFENVKIGGQGSMLDTISVQLTNNLWETATFATGGYVHNKNLSTAGTININVSQISDDVAKFKQMCSVYYKNDYQGFTISISDIAGNNVCNCYDCYIQKIPNQDYSSTAGNQSWVFVAGEIYFA